MKRTASQKVGTAFVVVFLLVTCLFVLYPLVYVVSAAFSPGLSISSMDIVPFAKGFTTEHFEHLFKNTNYLLWFRNSFIIAACASIGTLIVATLGAYVFSRFRFTFKKPLLMSLLILQIFPSFVGMVAIYVILLRIDGLDTLWGLVLVYVAGNVPYNIWLVKSYVDTIPRSLDEAALLDGASYFKIFYKIVMPVAKPILIFLGITSFTTPWMDFVFPKMVLRSAENQTLALGLFSLVTDKKNQFTVFAAGALLIAIPMIILFVLTQKTMVTSFGASAVKE